jgi:hypothetical protein
VWGADRRLGYGSASADQNRTPTAIANAQGRDEAYELAEEQAALRRVAILVAREARPEEVFAAEAEEILHSQSSLGRDGALRAVPGREPVDGTTRVLGSAGKHRKRPQACVGHPRSRLQSRRKGNCYAPRSGTTGSAAPKPRGGSGLIGLIDRVEALGGRFALDSPLRGGTRISIELPLAAPRVNA